MNDKLIASTTHGQAKSDIDINEKYVPLIVDLDGTLTTSDTLWESLLHLIHTKPWLILLLPYWLIKGGRPRLKYEISKRITIDVTSLPYRQDVINKIISARSNGRVTILATAATEQIASAVANHLGVFDHIIASTRENNLKAKHKLAAISDYLGDLPFDYIGDSKSDIPIWRASRKAFAVSPNKTITNALNTLNDSHHIGEHKRITLKTLLKSMRIHQWAKNILLFAPLVLSQQYTDIERLITSIICFFVFSLSASSTYIWNDLLDLPSDRCHPSKCKRPLAANDISIASGVLLSLALISASFSISIIFLPILFTIMLVGYIVLSLSYSFYFKRKLMTDVLMLGGLYAYRILIGAIAIDVVISPWLLAFSIFFFLSLAFVKRFTDLNNLPPAQDEKISGRGYYASDSVMVQSLGTSASYISVLIMALYVSSPTVADLYSSPYWLWLLCIIFLYWISRIWFLAARNQIPEDPVLFAVKDKISYLTGLSVLIILLLASL